MYTAQVGLYPTRKEVFFQNNDYLLQDILPDAKVQYF